MPYKARQFLKSGEKTYAPGEVVPGVENSPNLFALLQTNYLYYVDPEPEKAPDEGEKEDVEQEPKKQPAKPPSKKR